MTNGLQHHAHRPGSSLPLILAGAALVTALYLLWDRAFPGPVHRDAEPRPVTPRGELSQIEQAVITIYENNRPSVVHITSPEVGVRTRYGYATLAEGTGSGFVWDERGYVVTNFHVIQARRKVLVRLDNQKEYVATVVGARQDLDIAVVKLDDPLSNLRPIQIGTSGDLRVGQTVLAIGNPFGLDHSLSTGVISALNRTIQSLVGTPIRDVIQVDAAINPGNSGGPLLDSAGRLIGMNTAIKSPSGASAGVGFAVPVDTINSVVPEIIRGAPEEPDVVLGITVTSWNPQGRPLVMITEVQKGSGAEEAGLQGESRSSRSGLWYAGDVLVSVAGRPIRQIEDIWAAIRGRSAGERVPVEVVRGLPYERKTLTVEVELRPAERFR